MLITYLVAGLTVAAPSNAAVTTGAALAVLPLNARRVESETVAILDEVLTTEMARRSQFRIISANDLNAMLGLERMKESLGCDDVACAAEIGGALGVRFLLTGSVSKLGSKIIVTLSLMDTATQEVRGRASATVDNNEDLYASALAKAVNEVLGHAVQPAAAPAVTPASVESKPTPPPVMSPLAVRTEPAGAVVILDGAKRGTTPFTLADIPAGHHKIRVAMPGFAETEREVMVTQGLPTLVDLRLETHAAHEERIARERQQYAAGKRRGWIVLGSGAAVTAIGALVLSSRGDTADEYAAYVEARAKDVNAKPTELESAFSSHNKKVYVGWTLVGAGLIGATYGLIKLAGGPPVEVAVGPASGGGGALVVSGRF